MLWKILVFYVTLYIILILFKPQSLHRSKQIQQCSYKAYYSNLAASLPQIKVTSVLPRWSLMPRAIPSGSCWWWYSACSTELSLIPLPITASFLAVYLTSRRSPYFALAYAANDIVLIVLWVMASITNIRYISIVVCFVVFLFNDIYGSISWQRIKKRQYKE